MDAKIVKPGRMVCQRINYIRFETSIQIHNLKVIQAVKCLRGMLGIRIESILSWQYT